MTSAGKVADIFAAAGEAFTRLGTLTMQLQPLSSEKGANGGSQGGKWGEEEINLLKEAVTRFGEDLATISDKVKKKSVAQTKSTLRDKVSQPQSASSTTLHGSISGENSMPALGPISSAKQDGQKVTKTKITDSKCMQSPPAKKSKIDGQTKASGKGFFEDGRTDNDLTIDVEG